jgi:iron-sulfur cluster repair protein YtfE (RIC family)
MSKPRSGPAAFAFTADDRIGQFLNQYPESRHWFRDRGLSLSDSAASLRRVLQLADPSAELLALALAVDAEPWSDDPDRLCGGMTLDELVDHLCSVHHAYTRAELGRLTCIAEHVRRQHPSASTTWFARFIAFRRDLLDHLDEEEALLFPACRDLELSVAARPISSEDCSHELTVMEHGHHAVHHEVELLQQELRALSWPEALQPTAMVLISGLATLAQDLRVHSYIEEEYLLPAMIQMDELFDARHRARTGHDALNNGAPRA